MSDNITDFLFKVTMTLMFIIAVSSLLFLYNSTSKTISLIENSISNERVLQEGRLIQEDYYVKGGEIISQIKLGLERPIEIEGLLVDTNIDIYSFNLSFINPTGIYDAINIVDGNGIIIKVVYSQR